eukprot:7387306-Prymnesium_polylepis.1
MYNFKPRVYVSSLTRNHILCTPGRGTDQAGAAVNHGSCCGARRNRSHAGLPRASSVMICAPGH